MSRNLSDDEDMTSSTPSSPSTPVTAAANPHIPPHLDPKTPPQSQDNTPYIARTGSIGGTATSQPSAGGATSSTPTLQTFTSASSSTLQGAESITGAELTSSPTRRRPSGAASAVLGGGGGTSAGAGGANGGASGSSGPVSVLPSSEPGVPAWLTKRGLEEIANVEERLLDRQFSTQMYGSIFSDKDVNNLQK
ncbi:hypothetical protein DRE_02182 [Drechslerella stenobrocha 248]|uniref:Uncharacterized protein n=1 Tax=Drechslerella stenobrocha 248 TaxID=1043628 RepID=W7I7U8_9PEZI|nr:hypothetical protein DRE_02182 [Drechslerella stenobrocha 248]